MSEHQNASTLPQSLKTLRHHIEYRPDIDGLRAIAVISVLLFHAFPTVLRGGFVGVDIFFVISGYLISRIILDNLRDGNFKITDFYARRIRRIFPALMTVLIVCIVFGWNTLLADDLALLAKHVLGGVTFISNFILWSEAGYFDKASELKPLLHLWSLGIEEQFYLVWPVLLWVGWRLRFRPILIIVILGVASFSFNLLEVHPNPTETFYSPLTRGWELIVGAGWACLSTRLGGALNTQNRPTSAILFGSNNQILNSAISAIGLSLVAYAMLRINDNVSFPGMWAVVPTFGALLLIVAGPDAWVNRILLSNRVIVAIGLISFPLYLWHWPVLTFAKSFYPEGLPWMARMGLLLLSTALAAVTYVCIEKPFRLGRHKSSKVTILCTTACLVAGLSGLIIKSGGFTSRYPEIIQRATEYDLDGYRAALRNRVCFMDIGQDASEYATECEEKGTAPLWLLWGDSGAAAVYSGLRSVADSSGQFRIAQFTSSACPPMVGYEGGNPACVQNNQWTIDKIRELTPDTVILAGMWSEYVRELLPTTIKKIQSAGVRRVIILGPAPAWKDTPSRIVFNIWNTDPLHRVPPARLDYTKYGMGQGVEQKGGLDNRTETAEQQLRAMAQDTGAVYISIVDKMCNSKGCLMRESEASGAAFYLDIVHFTPRGASFAMNAIAPELGIQGAKPQLHQ